MTMGTSTKGLSPIISVIPGQVGYPGSTQQTGFEVGLYRLQDAQDGPAPPHVAEHRQLSTEAEDRPDRHHAKNFGVTDHPHAKRDLDQASLNILLTDRLSMPQAIVGSTAVRVPVRSLLQAVVAAESLVVEESLMVEEHLVLELLEVAGRVEDSMAEGIDNSISSAVISEEAFDTNDIWRNEQCLNIQ